MILDSLLDNEEVKTQHPSLNLCSPAMDPITEMGGVSTFTTGKNYNKNNLSATGGCFVPLSL